MKLWKRILFFSITFLFAYYIYKNRSQLFELFQVFSGGILRWLVLALIFEFIGLYFLIRAHQYSLQTVKIRRTTKELLPLVLGSLVINTTTPTAGTLGAVLFADDAIKRKESPLSAITGIFLLIISYFYGLLGILFMVLAYLRIKGELGPTEVIFTGVLLLITAAYTFLIYLADKKPDKLRVILTKISSNFGKILKFFKVKTNDDWVKSSMDEFTQVYKSIKKNPKKIAEIVSMQFATHAANILCLLFIFLAFGETVKFGVIVSGYAIGELFRNASPAPEGVGVTEAAMTIIYSSFGIDPIDAAAISLVYRGLNFWLPFGIGFIMMQAKHLFPEKEQKA